MTNSSTALKEQIVAHFTPEERDGLERLKNQIIRQYANLGKPISKDTIILEPSREQVIEGLKGKNLLVMCGGGKDSEIVLTGARAIQLMLLEEYGITFNLRVGIGRQPGMIDVYDNLEHAFDALKLKNDPQVDLFFIDGKTTRPYHKDTPIPENVIALSRANALINGHIFSGAGRRTFCDDCNKNLAGWIATGLAYKGGTDLFMTGDSRKELRAQIGTAVPQMAKSMGVDLPQNNGSSPTQHAFALLDTVGREHSKRIHGSDAAAEERSIDHQSIPDRSQFVPFFSAVPYESRDRLFMLKDFLGFSLDSLMFSFTESDCGNPALMCHLYGLIAEHAHGAEGSTYNDGVRMYVEYGIGKMREKGFPDSFVEKMRDRYSDDAHIQEMRGKVEEYAQRAYGFRPEHLVAMVYAPFTEHGTNLRRYLQHVATTQPDGRSLLSAESKIQNILTSDKPIAGSDEMLVGRLQELTGLNITQMRHLYNVGLAINNFDPHHRSDDRTENLRATMDQDKLYIGTGALATKDGPVQLTIRGR